MEVLRAVDAYHAKAVYVDDGVVHKEKVGPWSPSVQALLRHFERAGFEGAPRVIGSGFDGEGRETLTYIEGTSPHPRAWTLDGAFAVGRLLRQIHAASASFVPPAGAVWYPLQLRDIGGSNRLIGHCDSGPWNIVGRDGLPVAFIDWECAGPVDPLLEVAQTGWLNAQLHDDSVARAQELPSLEERARQLRAILDGYELPRRARGDFVELMVQTAICFLASSADDVNAGVTSFGPLWGFAWPSRGGAWMLKHRAVLQNALS
ncbi:MAG: phosphotransferase [Chloroflexi bacterium]|nr:phosphotransferase [Chloroflexota bacterium]